MKLEINYNGGVLSIPADILERLESFGETEIKVLLYLCSQKCDKNDFRIESGCTLLGICPSDFENAVSFLRGMGVIRTSGKGSRGGKNPVSPKSERADEKTVKNASTEEKLPSSVKGTRVTVISNSPPQYTGEELDKKASAGSPADRVRKELESPAMLSRPLRANELNMIVALMDYYGFDEAYVLQLLANFIDKSNPIKYAYTVGVSNYEKNILTYDQLLEEMARLEEKNSFEKRIKKLFGIDERSLTAKEKRFFEEWQKYDFDLVRHAYEITVDQTGKAAMPYMNRVLTSFAEAGIKTVEQAMENARQFKENQSAKDVKSGFDTDEFFRIAVESSNSKK